MRFRTTILLTVTLIACSACASPSQLWWGMFGQKIEEDVSELPDGVPDGNHVCSLIEALEGDA